MLPGKLSRRVVVDRLAWIDRMISEIRALPLTTLSEFLSDSRNIWAAESCLRRALEAMFDLGRHILAKGYSLGVTEYKEIATNLFAKNILSQAEADLMRKLAGYRNRLVHFYHDVSAEELYEICANYLQDIETVVNVLRDWLKANQDLLDDEL
jgi:uncharacterized protein YutE (UPF0331/DUF86 family)